MHRRLPGQLGGLCFVNQLITGFLPSVMNGLGGLEYWATVLGLTSSVFGCFARDEHPDLFSKNKNRAFAPPPRGPACLAVPDGDALGRLEMGRRRAEPGLGWVLCRQWAEPERINPKNGLHHQPAAACPLVIS